MQVLCWYCTPNIRVMNLAGEKLYERQSLTRFTVQVSAMTHLPSLMHLVSMEDHTTTKMVMVKII